MPISIADHRSQWQPPQRPEWVQRVNEEGYCMNIRGVVPLDEHSLLESAMRSTGLSDFGVDDWREPFKVLVKALDEEADLNLMGRLRTRSELLQLLEARLQVEHTYKLHPEIDEQQVSQPIIIVGQGRSGTTFLHYLLASNPDHGTLMHWEAVFPCPPPESKTYTTDPRIEKAHKLIDQWNRVTPSMKAIKEFAAHLPMEDTVVISMNFLDPSWASALGQTPTYAEYVQRHDITPSLLYHQRVLKLLQWKNPRRSWILKDPFHLDRLAQLHKIYPDACFVWPHRDPVKALASTVSLIGTIQWGRSDHPFKGGSMEYLLDPAISAARFNSAIEQLEAGVVPPKQFHHLLYKDLVEAPLSAVEAMYEHFGICLSDRGRSSMSRYVANNARGQRTSHKYHSSDEAAGRARKAYKRYQEYFRIPSE